MIDPSRVRVTGPLAPFAPGFAAELSRQGYAPASIYPHMRLCAQLSSWLAAEGLSPDALSPEVVERFLGVRRLVGYRNYTGAGAAVPLLAYLRGLGVAPAASTPAPEGPVEELLCRYGRYLELERGLTPQVVARYVGDVRPLLQGLAGPYGFDLACLDAARVVGFVLERCRREHNGSARMCVTALRSLLRFLFVEGMIDRPLDQAVPSVAGWRLAGLPKRVSPSQVARLLSSCDRRTVGGRRDFAILTLLARLGLRRCEVARLCLDDLDWRAGEIVVRGKGGRVDRLPLPADVGEALGAYLRRGRPASTQSRAVFLRLTAPHRELTADAVSLVVGRATQRAGLPLFYAHRLRHTAASEMLRAGASLPEVGQVLRHRRAGTTAIYAKLDRHALRAIARPWPGGRS